MKSRSEIATEKFQEGFNCAQSVFYSFCDDLKFEKETALKLACGLGAGMGLKGEVCGAVSGGIIVLGAKYGSNKKNQEAATYLTYAKTRELMDQFAEKHGTCICRELLNGCDLTTEAGQKHFFENDLINTSCKPCVQDVVEILEQVMK
jgi:C_GCAxxG_C_C family probable redox protein